MTLSDNPRAARSPRARRRATALLLGATLIATGGTVALATPAVAADCSTVPWMDTSKSADERADALLDASTQHQKYRWLVEQPANSPTQTTWSGGVVYPVQVDCTPTVIYSNGAEGAHNKAGTTAWPGPIAIAASWNLALNEQKGAIHADEAFDNRSNVILGPGVASGRTPLSGRTAEYFGEDPLLSGLMGAANVRGIEDGGSPDKPVIANLKHYVANEQELDRNNSSSNMDERTFRQVYDLPYEIAIKESDPDSLMCSYNQINGVWACENDILTTSLRDKMGFDGYVMSDFGSVHSTGPSLMAGLDQELNRPIWFTPVRLDAALAAGEVTQERIDEAAFQVVRSYIKAGLFDHPLPATSTPVTATDESRTLARELAEQSAVLLKNEDGILPLEDGPLTVAVVGPTASKTPTNGISTVQACSAGGFGARGVLNCDNVVDPLTSITERVEAAGGTVLYNNGADLASVAATAAQADVAIVFGYIRTGEFSDIPDIRLDSNGDALVEAVAAANDDTVVVLNSGTAVEMPWVDDVDAVFSNWFAGEQMGPALAGLLWGDVNPSGKLPMTFPKSVADTPTGTDPARYPGVFSNGSTTRPAGSTEVRQVSYSEGLQVGYKWYDEQGIEPLFEFGHGLSYTEFEYSKLKVKTKVKNGAVETRVTFFVENEGDRAGVEIPQVYLALPDAAAEPGKRLVGFERIELAAGEKQKVEVVIDSTDSNQPYSIWDVNADAWTIVDGTYVVSVGSSSRDLPLTEGTAVDIDGKKNK
ncbi:beta-glucosidase family protein [Microbacterium sp. CFBP9034]|uniref:beta-glucosidase family protein n=1 Tax=Microbacterium sp. CFBP9034 TaxID=3096540 RepID=UPI002A6B0B35|nr:glycoside hydrolase family 3 C-terminal domain-containing protein [Microbacterium sp. CFBP9034]MDY0908818.1 glycoside hydrolase family 3 C-terminal domain-containing protein [Microbacterium sp. CFBP9034]